ncbi:MAG: GNAT family N-acetyltransferase [Flavobacteriaceae bacterium]|nr:GNAT family N-acetyltransferase [Flavobacteriaceae bacterium]
MKDPFYQKERLLRNKILLRPIGIPDFGWEKNDAKSWHFVAIDDLELIGCVVLLPLDTENKKAQLIQMAVDDSRQGQGIGRLLVEALIEFSKKIGLEEIQIHSRSNVTSFYTHLGFDIFGNEFEEVGVKHRYMRMYLNA